jgi:hypothetical protein
MKVRRDEIRGALYFLSAPNSTIDRHRDIIVVEDDAENTLFRIDVPIKDKSQKLRGCVGCIDKDGGIRSRICFF